MTGAEIIVLGVVLMMGTIVGTLVYVGLEMIKTSIELKKEA